jgi:hypothetical protein
VTSQQRRHRRYDVDGVQGSLLYSLDARVLNMSLTGMAIETTSFLKMGGQYWLRVANGDGQLRFKADVKWCRLVRNERTPSGDVRAVYQAGIDFREILDEHAREVLAFLEKHIVVELDRRLTGRFQLARPERAALSVRHDFEVRRLSMGGMLVETVWDPPVDAEVQIEVQTGRALVKGRAQVRSVAPVPVADPNEPPRFAVGLAFRELPSEDEAALAGYVQTLLE